MSATAGEALLRSFWLGGFEGADHVNAAGHALDMVRATGHLDQLEEDYRRAARLGLRTLRESLGWRLCEGAGGALDLGRAVRLAQAARAAGIQPLWTLMHYGLPPDLSLFDDALVERFARFAGAVARALRPLCPAPRFYTPVNEISFLAWAASTGGLLAAADGGAAVGSEASGYEVKRRLVRAALAGMAAIRAADPQARFLHVEPLVHVAAPRDRPELAPLARQIRDYQWQALDLLAGRLDPGLGGHEAALDWLGFNHYHSSQWEAQTETRLAWHLRDARRLPLSLLLREAWQRYRRPLLIAETGHVGMGRAAWLHDVAGEALRARALGLPLQGVCLYPLLDRPDWQEPGRWHRCGLWHVEPGAAEAMPSAPKARLGRVAVQPYARALQAWQCLPDAPAPRRLLVLLPTRWESLDAPLQRLLRRLSGEGAPAGRRARFGVLLVEPPRRGDGGPSARRHRLGPALELLVLRSPAGTEDAGFGRQDLPLLRQSLDPDPADGTLAWLMRWPLDRPLDRASLPCRALVLQPDAQTLPPGFSGWDEGPDLLLCEAPGQAEALARGRVPVLLLPLTLPPGALRQPPPDSYESREVRALLGPCPAPRLLVTARPGQVPDPRRLEALARLRPQWSCLMLGGQGPAQGRWPANCRGLGALAPELLPALLRACDAGLVLDAPGPATAHRWPELACLGPGAGLPLLATPLPELRRCGVPGLRIVRDVPALVDAVEALLQQPRPRRRARAHAERVQERGQERALVRALLDLLETGRTATRPLAQGAWRGAPDAPGSAAAASAGGR